MVFVYPRIDGFMTKIMKNCNRIPKIVIFNKTLHSVLFLGDPPQKSKTRISEFGKGYRVQALTYFGGKTTGKIHRILVDLPLRRFYGSFYQEFGHFQRVEISQTEQYRS